jgi:hypothetical protein
MPKHAAFHRAVLDRPGMFALAFLLVASSIIQLTGIGLTADALEGLLPEWAFVLFAVTYGISGLLIITGMATDRLNVEASGDILAASGVVVRLIAMVYVLPFSVAVVANAFLFVVFGATFLLRYVQCVKGEHIIRVDTRVYVIAKREGEEDGPR